MTQNNCSNCGEPLKEHAIVCSNCGAPVKEHQENKEQPSAQEKAQAEQVYETPKAAPKKEKSTFLALILSFFIPGLGQVYNGNFWKGVLFMFAVPIGAIFLIIPGIAIWIYGMYDAYTDAEKINKGEKPYKEPTVWEIIGFLLLPFIVFIVLAILALLLFMIIAIPFAII